MVGGQLVGRSCCCDADMDVGNRRRVYDMDPYQKYVGKLRFKDQF